MYMQTCTHASVTYVHSYKTPYYITVLHTYKPTYCMPTYIATHLRPDILAKAMILQILQITFGKYYDDGDNIVYYHYYCGYYVIVQYAYD